MPITSPPPTRDERSRTYRPRIKICGLTREQDVRAAAELGADLLGFIHVPGSPRHLDLHRLAELLATVPPGPETVVVVRNEPDATLKTLRNHLNFHWFQFHGDESPEKVAQWGGYKVVHVPADATSLDATIAPRDPFFLLDTSVKGQSGGTGKTFDWGLLARVEGACLVAGGLRPDNVGRLVETWHPWGIDVSSGVESAPGRKDPDALRRFFAEIDRACGRPATSRATGQAPHDSGTLPSATGREDHSSRSRRHQPIQPERDSAPKNQNQENS
ncbi:N-(5'-phosphoribosyl)anthranilate isomerase [Sulfidibacter corallicola]|uniref:N-(5'-phosphoribosyl)anthranilate isomerase n=1 Tax=Sulfidibacter corallicola TaxID=2818388 RepID=A0A8A4TXY0_SULCO|nr:phosphoribosylanthranilate isomerase [Sulfidibacter corallicola]QTD53822.1 phosphoribosylanthranilate isomerase [Sulfidibacter corallicola]